MQNKLTLQDIDARLDSLGTTRNKLSLEIAKVNGFASSFSTMDSLYRKIESIDKTIKLNQLIRFKFFMIHPMSGRFNSKDPVSTSEPPRD